MFQEISEKFDGIFKRLRGHGKLSEKNISESMREVRRVLLEADVNYKVVKQFIASVEKKAVGQDVLKSITPGQQVIKIIHDELAGLMGEKQEPLTFSNRIPGTIMLVGLQGSGKTTTAGKLATFIQQKGRKPLLVAADVYRPAAVEQLRIVGREIDTMVYSDEGKDVVKICKEAESFAKEHLHDTLIIDTAGRLHVDETMMDELDRLKSELHPEEILFVADGMTGQDAVNTAKVFTEALDFTGVILTKMDGDARGGAALSVRAVTGKPIKFLGVGEKYNQIEVFHPARMASRILGMGDVVSLVEKAQQSIDQEKAAKLEQKMMRDRFTLTDFYEQLQQIKKMGPLQDVLSMLPGNQKALKNMQVDENALVQTEAIINSMTIEERMKPHIINGSRRKRIAYGSGTRVQDVNRLLNQFTMMQKMLKRMKKGRGMSMPFGL
ncbi:signal recognition particle protein [candidate division KSB1 bacterium]|nr:signal recognition particle protein [candidate division KSB1 bacterium]